MQLYNLLQQIIEDALFDQSKVVQGIESQFYINPSVAELNELGGGARGILTINGNLILANKNIMHQSIINFLIGEGLLRSAADWKNNVNRFIGLKQNGTTIQFYLADSYPSNIMETQGKQINNIINHRKNVGITAKIQIIKELSTLSD